MSERLKAEYLKPRYLSTWLLIGVIGLTALMPRRMALDFGAAMGRLFYRRNAKRREIVRINIEMCFVDLNETQREEMVRQHFEFYGRNVVDFGLAWWGSPRTIRKWVQFRGVDRLDQAHKDKRRVILITPHAVGMDLGGILLSERYPSVSMMKRAPDDLLNWMLIRGRERMGGVMMMRDNGLRPLLRAIRNGRQCYFIPDEDFGAELSVFAPFFGVPTATLTVVGRLARLTDAVVLPMITWLDVDSGRYTVDIGAPLEDFPSGDDTADAIHVNAALEERVRLAPAQYMWTLRWFKTRPDGGPSPYDQVPDRIAQQSGHK
ncbi:MAG: acyltransferase [marine bacterium B5-7]|nr:MAG: acyltransferase [marine bacterium B5-7]